jgi:hypothetical protein
MSTVEASRKIYLTCFIQSVPGLNLRNVGDWNACCLLVLWISDGVFSVCTPDDIYPDALSMLMCSAFDLPSNMFYYQEAICFRKWLKDARYMFPLLTFFLLLTCFFLNILFITVRLSFLHENTICRLLNCRYADAGSTIKLFFLIDIFQHEKAW